MIGFGKTDGGNHKTSRNLHEEDFSQDSRILMDPDFNMEADTESHHTTTTREQMEEKVSEINIEKILRLTRKPEGKYRFQKSIGHGGMKTVLQVHDRDTSREIAMAIMPDSTSRPQTDVCRFIREARIVASLEHPNIVPVHDIGIDSSNSPYFTMKLLKGETLAAILKKLDEKCPEYEAKFDLTRLLQIYLKVCNAIAYAHSKGIVHLDLKPDNVQVGDFGEVLVLDWGLSKVIGQEDPFHGGGESSTGGSVNPAAGDTAMALTMDGVTKGTPGYMSPEQAAGRNRDKDMRTDIYALGAILYAILTHKNPVDGDSVDRIIYNTVRGNITPPKLRRPDLMISSALEAVTMKALQVNPDDRYQDVTELRDEIYAFIGGFTTDAEKAGFFRKTWMLINRHKLTSSFLAIILLLSLTLGGYALMDVSKQTAGWIKVYEQDFTKGPMSTDGLAFLDKLMTYRVNPWSCDSEGLKMEKQEWLWFNSVNSSENTRVVVKVRNTANPDALEVCLNSRPQELKNWWIMPRGYSFLFSAFGGSKDAIYKNESAQEATLLNIVETPFKVDVPHTVVVEREDEKLRMSVDGRETIKVVDIFPSTAQGLSKVGVRSLSSSTRILSVSIYRQSLPEKASPLVAGDTLAQGKHFEEAVEKYLTLAENYGPSPVSEKALIKAYLTAATAPDMKNREKWLDEIRRHVKEKFPGYKYADKMLEIDAMVAWKRKRTDEALRLARAIFEINPETTIILRLLQSQRHAISKDTAKELFALIKKTKTIRRLNLSDFDLENIDDLKDMQLTFLDISNNRISKLDALKGMKLEILSIENNRVESLEPLRNMPLKDLNCKSNRIESLEPLSGMPLRHLDISHNRVQDITVLGGIFLERLVMAKNSVASLEPLKGLGLKYLDCSSNIIEDLSPLSGMPLEVLKCENNLVRSLDAVTSDMPLYILDCSHNEVKSLKPLENCILENLNCSFNPISSLAPLEGMPLSALNCGHTPVRDLSYLKGMPLKSLDLEGCNLLPDVEVLKSIKTLETVLLPAKFRARAKPVDTGAK